MKIGFHSERNQCLESPARPTVRIVFSAGTGYSVRYFPARFTVDVMTVHYSLIKKKSVYTFFVYQMRRRKVTTTTWRTSLVTTQDQPTLSHRSDLVYYRGRMTPEVRFSIVRSLIFTITGQSLPNVIRNKI
jgi:hypothetical protein